MSMTTPRTGARLTLRFKVSLSEHSRCHKSRHWRQALHKRGARADYARRAGAHLDFLDIHDFRAHGWRWQMSRTAVTDGVRSLRICWAKTCYGLALGQRMGGPACRVSPKLTMGRSRGLKRGAPQIQLLLDRRTPKGKTDDRPLHLHLFPFSSLPSYIHPPIQQLNHFLS